jgi:hypothetical protein
MTDEGCAIQDGDVSADEVLSSFGDDVGRREQVCVASAGEGPESKRSVVDHYAVIGNARGKGIPIVDQV